MAVVIRLQGLRITAGPEDIRKFFTGLKIPDGGVHVIGGEREEAFIIFASDEDARRAMTRSGGLIRGSPVILLLSSKTEMQTMLERSTKIAELDQQRQFDENARRARRSLDSEDGRASSRVGNAPFYPLCEEIFCLYLKGLPYAVTEEEVHEFFSGLLVEEVILMKNNKGFNNGTGYVKFATAKDAMEGQKRDREYIGSRYVEVNRATSEDWDRANFKKIATSSKSYVVRDRSPIRSERSLPYEVGSSSPVAQRPVGCSEEEYCVLLDNLSYAVDKGDIKKLFYFANLQDDQILHLIDHSGRRTRSSFVLFKSLNDYCQALAQEKRDFFNRSVYTRPISRENMLALLESGSTEVQPSGSSEFQKRPPSYQSNPNESEKMCLFVRNLPFDVRKVEIMDFFHGFNINEDKVFLLRDHKGAGVGMALVLFPSEAAATEALCLNGRRFLGSEVILKCISHSEMQQLGVEPPMGQEDRSSGGSSGSSYRSGNTGYFDLKSPRDGNAPVSNAHGSSDYDPFELDADAPRNRGSNTSAQHFDGPTCVKLINLPFQIRIEEIYDFCYGYNIIPGSISLQFDESGKCKGSATVVFESRQEALIAIRELNGRPIGPRKIQLEFV
ncbi:RNA binding motif protein 12Bb [Betta splendens]|uniref:RNA binding motif protein 12Bb n=1 Tax=Betta splendens TaxID=158456 RepID=A0A6P7KVD5_BETSP|nr:RNA binding motif protein 12Bb [Betta splendens]